MSDSGKVSSPGMTPERKEEIEFWYRVAEKSVLIKYVSDLLAALEESQQQVNDFKSQRDHYKEEARKLNQLVKDQQKDIRILKIESNRAIIETQKECERLKSICNQLAGEEMLFQEGKYETEMQRLKSRLVEAQQTIARYKSALETIRDNTDDQGAIDCVDEALGEGAKES